MGEELFRGECGHEFRPEGLAGQLLDRVQSGDMPLAMIECPVCHSYTSVDAPNRKPEPEEKFRCPVETCIGWVCKVDDGESTFFGCGECGNVWADRPDLFEAISEVVKKHKYRRKVYLKAGKAWKPAPLNKEPGNYEDLVAKEWDDQ